MVYLLCRCMVCDHTFADVAVDCNQEKKIYCPLCNGGVEVEEAKLPQDKKWASCVKANCKTCKKKSN